MATPLMANVQEALRLAAGIVASTEGGASDPITLEVQEFESLNLTCANFSAIQEASWGAEPTFTDVKGHVELRLLACQPLQATNDNLGGDPAGGQRKTLKVTYLPTERQSINLPSGGGDLTVYRPEGFRTVRAAAGISEDDFFASLTQQEMTGGTKQDSGKSGMLFWFSSDGRYTLKTVPEGELRDLLTILNEYIQHLEAHEDSLLTRYLGAYSFVPTEGSPVTFVVMNNVFEGAEVHVAYDLKGTTEDRWVDEEEGKVLKDNNFAASTLYSGADTIKRFHAVIAADTAFLEGKQIMDYSLLVGLQYLDRDPEKRIVPSYSKLMGGVEGAACKGLFDQAQCVPCIIYIGIVDMLVTYGLKKRVAHYMKANTIGILDEIDTEPPDVYAERFRNYFKNNIITEHEKVEITSVPPAFFETPLPPLGRSGGTAAFFQARLVAGADDCPEVAESPNYWIAKDLSHAREEIAFYESAKQVLEQPGFELLRWMTPYKGVCAAPCLVKEGEAPKECQVMLIRNCRDGYKSCRMLDVKIGWATAVAGWQGKSALRAWKQGIVDSATNSVVEGFRLEGFDNPPPTLRSFEELLPDSKKVRRLNLQRMDAFLFMRHFLDLHSVAGSMYASSSGSAHAVVEEAIDSVLMEVELQELILLSCIEELAALAAAARKIAVPQQWLGSSIMLAFDSSLRPPREVLGRMPPSRGLARVHIFDWGRSELNMRFHHDRLSSEDKASREKYWGLYCGGVAKLLYDCMALYVARYWHKKESFAFAVWDKDLWSDDDFIGVCFQPAVAADKEKRDLTSWAGQLVTVGLGGRRPLYGSGAKKAQLATSVSPFPLPASSRLRDGFRARVHDAANIPNMDGMGDHTDAFVEVMALPEDVASAQVLLQVPGSQTALRAAAHLTTLVKDTEEPRFEEEFQFATLREEQKLDLLQAASVALGCSAPMEEAELLGMLANHSVPSSQSQDHKQAARKFARSCFPSLNTEASD